MDFSESVRALREYQSALTPDDPLYEAIEGISPNMGDWPGLEGTYLVLTKEGRLRTAFWGLDEEGASGQSMWSFWDTYDPNERPTVLEGVVCWWLLQENVIEFETDLPGGIVNSIKAYFKLTSDQPEAGQNEDSRDQG